MRAGFVRDLLLALGAVGLAAVLYAVVDDPGIHDLVIKTCIFGIFALSLNLLIGTLGLVAFGHAAFFAAGAYAFGLFMQSPLVRESADPNWAIPAGFAVAVAAATLLAAGIGAICIRAGTIYFSFLTLALQMILYSAILAFVSITGGDQGLTGGFAKPAFLGVDLTRPFHYYLFCVGLLAAVAVIMRQIVESPFGYALRMIRDNPVRAEFLGIAVQLHRWLAFVMAGGLAGIAGVMMSLFVVGAFPEFAYWAMSAEPLFMILLGGSEVFLGPVAGALILQLLNAVVTANTRYYGLVLGVVVLVFVLGLRRGLLDFAWALAARRREAGDGSAQT